MYFLVLPPFPSHQWQTGFHGLPCLDPVNSSLNASSQAFQTMQFRDLRSAGPLRPATDCSFVALGFKTVNLPHLQWSGVQLRMEGNVLEE